MKAARRFVAHAETKRPAMPPSTAGRSPSVSSWLRMRLHPAPKASRTAISFRRAAPRASIMIARFRQAINRTNMDNPDAKPASGASPLSPRAGWGLKLKRDGGVQIRVRAFGLAGSGMANCWLNVAIAAPTFARVRPGFSRPISIKLPSPRSVRIRETAWPGLGLKVGAIPTGKIYGRGEELGAGEPARHDSDHGDISP